MKTLTFGAAALLAQLMIPALCFAEAPARPAPVMSSEDVEAPAAAPSSAQPTVPWYLPAEQESFHLAKPPAVIVSSLSATYELHGFVSGTVSGVGSELSAHFGSEVIGGHIGVYAPGGWFTFGLDILRFAGHPIDLPLKGIEARILFPDIDATGVVGPNGSFARLGTSVTGIRLTRCPFRVDLRILTLYAWIPIKVDGDSLPVASPLASIGASLDIGGLL